MLATVIVCTYNRCTMLARVLDSVAASTIPGSVEWEVLVVDNNSTDQTREVVEGFRRRYPGRFRYLRETQQGLSFARNAGVRESRADVVAFLDDDATVDAAWLWNLTAELHSGEWAGAGGPIIPVWDAPLPEWLPADDPLTSAPYGAFDAGHAPGPLTRPPFGSNMAFRKEVFEKHGGFRTDLGRSSSDLLMGEDTDFGTRLLNNGERLRYEPSAVVYHVVPETRFQREYVLGWWFWHARSQVGESAILPSTKWSLGGVPIDLFLRLAACTLRWFISIEPSRRFSWKRNVWYIAGAIVGYYRCSHRVNPRTPPVIGIAGPDREPSRTGTST